MLNIAILASHNGSGFEAIYKAMQEQKLDAKISVLISNNTHAKALQKAKEYGIEAHLVNAKNDVCPDETIYELLLDSGCDIIFLSGYMKKLPKTLTDNFTILNSHPSLLPKYGGSGMYGSHVHEAVIKNGETLSGVTIHSVNEIYDDGEIILQETLQIERDDTVASLEKKIKNLEKIAIIEAIKKFTHNK